ncbi:MAG: trypsin [Deltaproteobacteria bacterium]|nr:MAG: trypsin [Deltaproteobacteria bacterium]
MLKILASGFAIFLAVIIVLADSGRGQSLFALVRHLPGGDITGHFLLLGTMSLLLNAALKFKTFSWRGRNILWGTVLLLAIATLEESSQIFFVSRSFSWSDMAANTVGILVFGEMGRWVWTSWASPRKKAQSLTSPAHPQS